MNEINKRDELESAFSNFNIEDLRPEIKGNVLIINGYPIINVIKGKDIISTVKSKISNIIKDTQISNILVGLRSSRKTLQSSLEIIQRLSSPISQTIESGDYDIKAKCCPTIFGLIKKNVR